MTAEVFVLVPAEDHDLVDADGALILEPVLDELRSADFDDDLYERAEP